MLQFTPTAPKPLASRQLNLGSGRPRRQIAHEFLKAIPREIGQQLLFCHRPAAAPSGCRFPPDLTVGADLTRLHIDEPQCEFNAGGADRGAALRSVVHRLRRSSGPVRLCRDDPELEHLTDDDPVNSGAPRGAEPIRGMVDVDLRDSCGSERSATE
jgi:hypothetical protein